MSLNKYDILLKNTELVDILLVDIVVLLFLYYNYSYWKCKNEGFNLNKKLDELQKETIFERKETVNFYVIENDSFFSSGFIGGYRFENIEISFLIKSTSFVLDSSNNDILLDIFIGTLLERERTYEDIGDYNEFESNKTLRDIIGNNEVYYILSKRLFYIMLKYREICDFERISNYSFKNIPNYHFTNA